MQKHQRSRLSTVRCRAYMGGSAILLSMRGSVRVGLMIGLRISRMSSDRNRLNSRPPKNRGQATRVQAPSATQR